MSSNPEAIHRYLVSLVEQEDKRNLDCPNDWEPYTVRDPAGGYFTDESAWEFILQLLKSGHRFQEVLQHIPPKGAHRMAYFTVVTIDGFEVYIKIRPAQSHRIMGRSFHYSERS